MTDCNHCWHEATVKLARQEDGNILYGYSCCYCGEVTFKPEGYIAFRMSFIHGEKLEPYQVGTFGYQDA